MVAVPALGCGPAGEPGGSAGSAGSVETAEEPGDATASSGSTDSSGSVVAGEVPGADRVAAAEALCPVMWTWVTDVGDSFNEAAMETKDLATAEQRRQRWFEMLDEMESLDRQLLVDVEPLAADPILSPLVADIEVGVRDSLSVIDDIRTLIDDTHEIDERPYQDRTSQVIIRVEKVIDVAKPELAEHDADGTLIVAFQQVPSCQQAVKDVDNGSTQFNG
jgi:hypothetical protein